MPLTYSPSLGRRIRAGDWQDQATSTYRKAVQAVDAGNFEEAAEYADFFADEARIIYGIVGDLIGDLRRFLLDKGMTEAELAQADAQILDLLKMPDGRPLDAGREFAAMLAEIRAFIMACGRRDALGSRALAEKFKETWRAPHDRRIDYICGLINEVLQRFGEEAVGEMHRVTIQPLFEKRYAKYDIRHNEWTPAVEALLYLTFEAMRAHLTGPGREGNTEFIEEADRYIVRFDPCGTGGRTLRPDPVEGTPPRAEPPYNWPVLKEKHDFSWNKEGVCAYCAHCCMVMELLPIDKFGYPLRVVEPPTYPREANAKCSWIMYKDATAVPEEYYRRVGRTKGDLSGLNGNRAEPGC